MASQASICGAKPTTVAAPNTAAALTATRGCWRMATSSSAGSSRKRAFCQRIAIMSPARSPNITHLIVPPALLLGSDLDFSGMKNRDLTPETLTQAQVKAATDAIDGAWLIDG